MEYRRPSLIGPLILITIGVLFLLANLGMLPFTFWEMAVRFWPLLLILIGLDIIIGRRSTLGALIIAALWVALIAGAIALATGQGAAFLPAAASITDEVSQPLGDIKSASIALNTGVADTAVTSLGSDSGDLVKGTLRHTEGTRVVKTYQVVGDEGRLAVREDGVNMFFGRSFSRWELGLNPAVPIALDIDGGLGRVVLDLSGLTISNLSIDSGVGSIEVTTPKTGASTMRLNGGVGSARVIIPQGVAARIRVSAGLGGINVDAGRFPRFGNVYQSADYANASNKIDIEVDGGVGGINVQ